MNKTEFLRAVATEAGSTLKDANAFYDAFVTTVCNAMKKGDKVALIGFGTFEAKKKAAEEAAKGLKVGNFTIKYGTYEATFGSEYNESYQGHDIITINPDGTFTRTLDGSHSDGRYYIYNEKCIGIGQDGICIGSVDSDGFFSDGSGIHYKYQK